MERAFIFFRSGAAAEFRLFFFVRLARSQNVRVVRLYDGSHITHVAVRQLDGVAIEDRIIWVRLREMTINNSEEFFSDLGLD